MRRTQLICPQCGSMDVTVYAERAAEWMKSSFMAMRETRVRCDKCIHQGPTKSFLRVRLTKNGVTGVNSVRPDCCLNIQGKLVHGELREVTDKGLFKFVGVQGGEILVQRTEIVLL